MALAGVRPAPLCLLTITNVGAGNRFCNTIDSVNKLRFFIQEKKRHVSGKVRTYYSSMTPDAKVNLRPSMYLLLYLLFS